MAGPTAGLSIWESRHGKRRRKTENALPRRGGVACGKKRQTLAWQAPEPPSRTVCFPWLSLLFFSEQMIFLPREGWEATLLLAGAQALSQMTMGP